MRRRRFVSWAATALAVTLALCSCTAEHAATAPSAAPSRSATSSVLSAAAAAQPPSLTLAWNPSRATRPKTVSTRTLPLCTTGQLRFADSSAGFGLAPSTELTVQNTGRSCALPPDRTFIAVGTGPRSPLLPRSGWGTTVLASNARVQFVVEARECGLTAASPRGTVHFTVGTSTASVGSTPWRSSCGRPVAEFETTDGGEPSDTQSGLSSVDVRLHIPTAGFRGGSLIYRVQLQANESRIRFTKCPRYVQWLESAASLTISEGTIDCSTVRSLAPGQYLHLVMHLRAPITTAIPGYTLGWSLVGGESASRLLQTPAETHPSRATAPAGVPMCDARRLTAVYEAWGGALGTDYADIDLVNTGATPCALHGHPTGTFVAYGDGTRVGDAASSSNWPGSKPTARVLLPAHDGMAVVRSGIGNAANYGDECDGTVGDGIRLRLPGVSGAVFAPFGQYATTVCRSRRAPQLDLSQVLEQRTTSN